MQLPNPDLVLVDFDDTLVETAPRFERARRELFDLLASLGWDLDEVERVHYHQVDPIMRDAHGLGPHRMSPAFRETYTALCRATGRDPDPELVRRCEGLGAAVAGTPPPIAGALAALRRLARELPTVIYTQGGDATYQLGCVRDAGAIDAVGEARVRVVPVKTAATFSATLEEFDVDPGRACMVGNSIRSDINPALEVGAGAILVEMENPWRHDVVEPIHNGFPRVGSFHQAVDLILAGDRRGGR